MASLIPILLNKFNHIVLCAIPIILQQIPTCWPEVQCRVTFHVENITWYIICSGILNFHITEEGWTSMQMKPMSHNQTNAFRVKEVTNNGQIERISMYNRRYAYRAYLTDSRGWHLQSIYIDELKIDLTRNSVLLINCERGKRILFFICKSHRGNLHESAAPKWHEPNSILKRF